MALGETTNLLEAMRQEQTRRLAESARGHFADFVKASWNLLEQGMPLSWSWHHDAICDHMEAVYRGDITRLVIALPPRHTKSTIISVAFNAWVWINAPWERFLTASYRGDLAIRDAERSRSLMESDWYQTHYGDAFTFSTSQNVKSWYRNDQGGTRIATSVQGGATGEGGQYVVCDDPHNIMQIESQIQREMVHRWWDSVMGNRLNDQKTGRMVLVAQRSHKYDLIGHVIAQGGYEYLMLPAEYDPARKTFTSIGWSDPRTEEGEPLWEEKFPREVLAARKTAMSLAYFAQYQQAPVSEEGNIIKIAQFNTYALLHPHLSATNPDQVYVLEKEGIEEEVLARTTRLVISSDFATGLKQKNDFTVLLLWALTKNYEALLLDILIVKVTGPEAEDYADRWCRKYQRRLYGIVVEDVANQKSIIQRLLQNGHPAIAYYPKGDKVARAHGIAVYIKAGQFYIPSNGHPNLGEFLKNLSEFPGAEHDDIVDAVSILLAIYQGMHPRIRTPEQEMPEKAKKLKAAEEVLRHDNPELYKFLKESDGYTGETINQY